MEFNVFMAQEGMIPQVIQLSSFDEETDGPAAEKIGRLADPYAAKSANIAPMQYIYDVPAPKSLPGT